MDWTLFIIFLCANFAAGATGSMFPPGAWYQNLDKPTWTPPNWVFPVAWMVLYLLMAAAAARAAVAEGSAYAMGFWTLQIALNTLWTPVFFGLRRLFAGAIVIVALWVSVLGSAISFGMVDPLAGRMLLPYVLWVSYAAALNIAILRMNPNVEPLRLD